VLPREGRKGPPLGFLHSKGGDGGLKSRHGEFLTPPQSASGGQGFSP